MVNVHWHTRFCVINARKKPTPFGNIREWVSRLVSLELMYKNCSTCTRHDTNPGKLAHWRNSRRRDVATIHFGSVEDRSLEILAVLQNVLAFVLLRTNRMYVTFTYASVTFVSRVTLSWQRLNRELTESWNCVFRITSHNLELLSFIRKCTELTVSPPCNWFQ